MNERIVILGGGLSGKIAKYIFRSQSLLISKEPSFNYGLFYVNGFLNDDLTRYKLSIENVINFEGDVHKEYMIRTRGIDSDINVLSIDKLERHNVGWLLNKRSLFYIDIDAKVINIDIFKKTVTFSGEKEAGTVVYDKLISTIPLLTLLMILSDGCSMFDRNTINKKEFAGIPIGLIYSNYKLESNDNYDILVNYLPRDKKCYRISTTKKGSVAEYSFACEQNSSLKIYNRILYPGKIFSSDYTINMVNKLSDKDIYCIGRYGEWKEKMMIHDVYNKLLSFKKEWNSDV